MRMKYLENTIIHDLDKPDKISEVFHIYQRWTISRSHRLGLMPFRACQRGMRPGCGTS